MNTVGVLVLVLLAVAVLLAIALIPRGTVSGRTPLIPGQVFLFRRTGRWPVLATLPVTRLRFHGHVFEFVLVRLPSGIFRAYIVGQPLYGDRPRGLGNTHRLTDTFGRPYVCWSPEPRNPNTLASVVALWIAATCHYLKTGTFADATVARQLLRQS